MTIPPQFNPTKRFAGLLSEKSPRSAPNSPKNRPDRPLTLSSLGRNLIAWVATTLCLIFFRALRWTLNQLPTPPLLAFASALGGAIAPLLRRERAVSLAQLDFAKRAPTSPLTPSAVVSSDSSLPNRDSLEVFRGALSHFAQMTVELLVLNQLLKKDPSRTGPNGLPVFHHLDSSGTPVVRRFLDDGKAIVALSGHIGNFELLAAYYAACGAKISVVGRSANYSALNALIDELRRGYGVENIERANSSSVSALRRALNDKRTLAVLIDQDTNLQSGFASFFGLEAATPIAPIQLAVRHSLPVISSFIVRTARMKHFVVTDEIVYDPNSPNAVQYILNTYTERLEALLVAYPDQWPWWHRRWRRRPGEDYRHTAPKSSRDYVTWLKQLTPPLSSERSKEAHSGRCLEKKPT